MLVGMFTDPHFGLRRLSGTTSATQDQFENLLAEKAEAAVRLLKEHGAEETYCLGDLFDKFSNSEKVIKRAGKLLNEIDFVLAGNHDISNVVGRISSLHLLKELNSGSCVIDISPDPSLPCFGVRGNFFSVPHCISGKVFEDSIKLACEVASKVEGNVYLLLHCNASSAELGTGFGGAGPSETELWLTPELQEICEEVFTRVFIGHEHEPKYYRKGELTTLKDAKIVILGNTFPLSFGEISDRYVYLLDTETNEITKVRSVDSREVLTVADVSEISESLEVTTPFLKIIGDLSYADAPKFGAQLYKMFKNNPGLFVIGKYYEEEGKSLNKVNIKQGVSIEEVIRKAAEEQGFIKTLQEIENANA